MLQRSRFLKLNEGAHGAGRAAGQQQSGQDAGVCRDVWRAGAAVPVPIRAVCYQQAAGREPRDPAAPAQGICSTKEPPGEPKGAASQRRVSPRTRHLSQDPTMQHSVICSTAGWFFKALHILFTVTNNILSSAFVQVYAAS